MEQRALVTGATGQLGSFMCEYLLQKGYKVYGLVRRSATDSTSNLRDVLGNKAFEIVEGDVTDQGSLERILKTVKPHEIYHFAAQSHVSLSFEQPATTYDIVAIGTLKLLEAIRNSGFNSKIVNAATSEMFGKVLESPQTETTPFYPRSPYGIAKVSTYYTIQNYRESYNMFASNAIMFNTESERRGSNFVTRKITLGVADIVNGKSKYIELGNLDSKRDWSYAGDMVDAYYKILHHTEPDNFVLASGETHSIKDFLQEAFLAAGIDGWEPYVKTNPRFLRPAEVDYLLGDSSKARRVLGWKPKVNFKELVKIMIESDIKRGK